MSEEHWTKVDIETSMHALRCIKRVCLESSEVKHSCEVRKYSLVLGQRIGLSPDDMVMLEAVALSHDLGKGSIAELLSVPRALTSEEMKVAKQHVGNTLHLLHRTKDRFLIKVAEKACYHHESWDGSGYPYGAIGEEIPILCRIVAVADNFSALTSHRPYRPAFSASDAHSMILQEKGKKFDPLVVGHFYDAYQGGEFFC